MGARELMFARRPRLVVSVLNVRLVIRELCYYLLP